MTVEEVLQVIGELESVGADRDELRFWKNVVPTLTQMERDELGQNLRIQLLQAQQILKI